MRRTVLILMLMTLLAGAAPGARAAPALQGSMAVGVDFNGFCEFDAGCAAFFGADCPDALARPDGATTSIVPVDSGLWDQTLTFSWSDVSAAAGDVPVFRAVNMLFAAGPCEMPPGLPDITLDASPDGRSRAVTVPHGARWIVAWSFPGTANVKWWAQ